MFWFASVVRTVFKLCCGGPNSNSLIMRSEQAADVHLIAMARLAAAANVCSTHLVVLATRRGVATDQRQRQAFPGIATLSCAFDSKSKLGMQ